MHQRLTKLCPSTLWKLATIIKLKYFGHTMHSSDSMNKEMILGLTDGDGKLRKEVYRMWGTVMMNWCNIWTATQNKVQWRAMICKAMKSMECQNKQGGSKTQYFLLTQSNTLTGGTCDLKALLLLNQLTGFLNTDNYKFHIIQNKSFITNILTCLHLKHKN